MKFSKYLLILVFFVSLFSLQSCLKDKCELTKTYYKYTPIYMTKAEMRATKFKKVDPIEMKNTGKIYFYKNYIFINEMKKGVHIIDNSDPKNPSNIAFLDIPGNMDISIKDHIIYAQSYLDLWMIDIENPLHPTFLNKKLDVFENKYRFRNGRAVVEHRKTDVVKVIDCNNDWYNFNRIDLAGDTFFQAEGTKSGGQSSGNNNSSGDIGLAGSFASMRIVGDYLYAIDRANLYVFSLKDNVNLVNIINVGWNIETLFPYQNKLFIGSTSGMFIFDNSDPVHPTKISKFLHIDSCDPVFVKGDKAYITLRNGTRCNGYTNQLEIVDISNISNPKLIKKYEMDNPHGLAIAGSTLFLCDGASGLKVYDIENDKKIKKLDRVKNIETYDVISLEDKKIIFVIGKDGLYQFDVSNPKHVKELSFMGIEKS